MYAATTACRCSYSIFGSGFCHVPSKLRAVMFFATFICAGFLSSKQFDQLAFEYEEHRTLGVVAGYQYDIKCTDNDAVPIWCYNGQEVTDSTSAAVHQISEAPNTKILKFSKFSADQIGEYTCSKPFGNFTVDISTGEIQFVRLMYPA